MLTKSHSKTKLYIGSGSNGAGGLRTRMSDYNCGRRIPQRVGKALENGYVISHKGILAHFPKPSPADVPRHRALCLALEGIFISLFCTAPVNTGPEISKWTRSCVEWDGLNTNSPFREPIIGDLELSAEQLEAIAASRKERIRAQMRERDAKYPERVKEWTRRKSAKRKANGKLDASRWARKDSGIHHCDVCDRSFEAPSALRRHNIGLPHLRRAEAAATGISLTDCPLCDFTSKTFQQLRKHKESEKHKRNVAASDGQPHLKRVESAKPFGCSLCKFTSKTAYELKLHKDTEKHKRNVAASQS